MKRIWPSFRYGFVRQFGGRYLVSTREENEFKLMIDNKWAYLTYGAKYFEPVMSHIRASAPFGTVPSPQPRF